MELRGKLIIATIIMVILDVLMFFEGLSQGDFDGALIVLALTSFLGAMALIDERDRSDF